MFVTVFFGIVDPVTETLAYCNAGHSLPYLLGVNRELSLLKGARGKPLGIRPAFTYESAVVELTPGDRLFVYTDGITEALNSAGDFFSEERLETALHELGHASARELVEGVMSRVRAFAADAAQADDIAVMGLRFVK
jgi:phosphoserine phosphatase RsbU/P